MPRSPSAWRCAAASHADRGTHPVMRRRAPPCDPAIAWGDRPLRMGGLRIALRGAARRCLPRPHGERIPLPHQHEERAPVLEQTPFSYLHSVVVVRERHVHPARSFRGSHGEAAASWSFRRERVSLSTRPRGYASDLHRDARAHNTALIRRTRHGRAPILRASVANGASEVETSELRRTAALRRAWRSEFRFVYPRVGCVL